jgi:hypothetical protein
MLCEDKYLLSLFFFMQSAYVPYIYLFLYMFQDLIM